MRQHLAGPSIDGKKAVSCEAQPEAWSTLIAPGVPHATSVVLLQRCKALRGRAGHGRAQGKGRGKSGGKGRNQFGTRVFQWNPCALCLHPIMQICRRKDNAGQIRANAWLACGNVSRKRLPRASQTKGTGQICTNDVIAYPAPKVQLSENQELPSFM